MHPIEVLSREHRIILRVLACLERIVDAGTRLGQLDEEDTDAALTFFKTFADDFHHAKEEKRLFPLLTERGLPSDSGPVAVMLHEHEVGRGHVRAMRESLPRAAAGEEEALHTVTHEARAFIVLLREHINKEDHILFPMSRSFLGPEDERTLAAGFEEANAGHLAGTEARMEGIADALCEKYHVREEEALAAGGGGPGGCCH